MVFSHEFFRKYEKIYAEDQVIVFTLFSKKNIHVLDINAKCV